MKRPGKLHIGLAALVILLLLLVGALVGIRVYLSSNRVTQKVADRLQALLGGTVRVGKADIGMHGNSTLQNVEVFEGKGEAGETPWLKADEIEADLSLLSVLRGETRPDRITLTKPRLVLRFDKHDHLLTRLPTGHGAARTFPRVHIDQGAITLEQEDRSPMIVEGITADAGAQGMVFQVNGTITDPSWGNWTARGSFDSSKEGPTSGDVALDLDTPHAAVTMAKLRSLPFVSEKVWKAVQAEGTTPVHFALNFNTARKGVHYHIELTPHDTRVDVPPIDLHAEQARGRVIIDNYVVDLQGVRGRFAGGSIATDAHLDFTEKTDRLAFKVQAHEVLLQKLPRSWKLPRVDGDLTGKADLVVNIDEKRKVHTRGSGDGEVTNFRWGLVKSDKPVPIHLRAEGSDFNWGGLPEPSALLPAGRGGPVADGGWRMADPKTNPPSLLLVPAVGLVAVAPPQPEAGTEGPGPVLSLLGQLPHGVSRMTHAITDGASTALRRASALAKPAPAPTAPRAPTEYLSASFSLEDIDLTQLIKQVGVRFPVSVSGRLSFNMQVAIPVDTPKDLRAYRLRGTATMKHLNVGGLEVATLRARVRYDDGVLDLQQLHGDMAPLAAVGKRAGAGFAAGSPAAPVAPEPGGTFDGHARYGVVPEGDFDADVTLDRIPLGTALNMMPDLARQVRGTVSGKLRAHAPAGRVQDAAAWRASGSLRSALVEAYGMRLKDAAMDLNLDKGVATLAGLRGDLQGTPLTGSAELRLTGEYPYRARLNVAKFNLALLEQVAPQFRPPFPVTGVVGFNGDIRGTARPFTIKANGKARASNLVVNGVRVDNLSFDVADDPNGIRLTHIDARLYKGEVTGSALLPVEKREAGTVNLNLDDVDVGALSKSLPKFPVPLEGRVTGTIKGEVTPATHNKPRGVTTQITIKEARQFRVRGIPAQRLHGYVDYHNGAADYDLEGEVFGGRFKLKGKYPSAERTGARDDRRPPARSPLVAEGLAERGRLARAQGGRAPIEDRPPDGRLELQGAQLGQVWQALHLENRLGPLTGRFSLTLPFWFVGPERRLVGDGTFRIGGLSWNDVPVAGLLQGDLLLRPDYLQARNLNGTIAGGILRAGFYFNLHNRRDSSFSITLEQADASRALAPFPEVARHIEGVLDVHLRGRSGPEWAGSGRVELTRGRVFGLSVPEWRFPLDFAFAPAEGRGELAVRDSGGRVGGGQVMGRANLRWDEGLSLDGGDLRFFNVDMRTLLSELGHHGSLATGRMSGRAEFSGSSMHSIDDLTALVYASFSETQAMQLPVLSSLAPFMGGATSNTTFQSGELRARLANGVFRIQRFGLHSNIMQLFIGGTVTLAGRLHLDADVRAGGLQLNGPLLALLGLRLPLAGAMPVATLARATILLANQVVHLHIVGTVRNPYVQVEARRLLSDEAVRFFLLAAPFPVP